jgi:hypothetical protein
MKNIVNTTLIKVRNQVTICHRQRDFLELNRGQIEQLELECLLDSILLTEQGLEFVPAGDGYKLCLRLVRWLDVTFTRQSEDFAIYQWVTEYNGLTITIQANEVISMNGTIPSPIP